MSLVRPEDSEGHPLLASDPPALGEARGNNYFLLEVRQCTILHPIQIGEGVEVSLETTISLQRILKSEVNHPQR